MASQKSQKKSLRKAKVRATKVKGILTSEQIHRASVKRTENQRKAVKASRRRSDQGKR